MSKSLFILFSLACLASSASYAWGPQPQEDDTILIECSNVRARTLVYQVVSSGKKTYLNVLSQNGHAVQRILVNAPYIFGDTFILTAPKGPGGYVHLYSAGRTSVIDIHLADNDLITTREPLTDFTCAQLD